MLSRYPFLFLLFHLTASYCLADYAWIPKYHNLSLKVGFDYLSSKENYDSEGSRVDLKSSGVPSQYSQYTFWVEPEYGFAQDFSAYLRPTFLRNSVDAQGSSNLLLTSPTSSGLGDTFFGLKWNLQGKPVILTLEALSKIPLYSTTSPAVDELVRGDGDYNLSLILHGGYQFNRHYFLGLSPGFKARFNGYSSQFLLDALGGLIYRPVFFRLGFSWATSLDKNPPAVVEAQNPELGSGGSYAVLSKNSDLFVMNIKAGVYAYQQYRIDLNFSQALMGNRAPAYWMIGFNVSTTWDFFKPEIRNRVREVPFDSSQED